MTTGLPSALLQKYDQPGPRYTSYPTAPTWTERFTATDYGERLRAAGRHDGEPIALYVHVPFCRSMCWYCGCNVIISKNRDKERRYVDDVLREAALVRAAIGGGRSVVQHHWGGGTPTHLPPDAIERLFSGLVDLFPLGDDPEVSIEVDPRVTTPAHVEALARLGFHRISMGVQDFDERVQQAIHRLQSHEETRDLIAAARAAGFRSVSLDLVYGLPHQDVGTYQRTLDAVLRLRPDRVACYGYAHVPWLKRHQRLVSEQALPRGRAKLALYETALAELSAGGYVPIGMDHFARPEDDLAIAAASGTLHRNFMGYTTRAASDMLSFGITAISEVDGAFAQNHKTIASWRRDLDAGKLPVERGLRRNEDDERRRRIILDLMCRFRVDFANHGGSATFASDYASELERLVPLAGDGLVELHADDIRVTDRGRLLVRNVAMVFDAHLRQQPPARDGARYSRTV